MVVGPTESESCSTDCELTEIAQTVYPTRSVTPDACAREPESTAAASSFAHT